MIERMRRMLGNYRYTAIAVVTLLTMGIVGAVVLTTTSVGCGPANRLGLKTARCLAGPVARISTPSPYPSAKGGYTPPPIVITTPSQPILPPASPATPLRPYDPNASAYPPYDPSLPPNSPVRGPASNGAPPLAFPGSGGGPPGQTFNCRLPVYAGGPGSGGFIVFPDQTFVADPRSAGTVALPSPAPSPSAQPGYPGNPQGWFGLTYDAHYSKWVAVPHAWLSPDGAHYAYPLDGDIYAVDVANGTVLELGAGQGYKPIAVQNDGVFVTSPTSGGLWFLPFSGAPNKITSTGFWQGVGGGAAYGTPTAAVPPGVGNSIQKLDLATGSISLFFSDGGGVGQVIGFDYWGNPVIQENYFQGEAMFIAGPQNYYAIAFYLPLPYYYAAVPPYPNPSPIADSHGLWFSVGQGVVLYTHGAWFWMSSIGGQMGGPCV